MVSVLAPLVVDLGGVLRSESMDGSYGRDKALWFFNGFGEAFKFAEVNAWMAEHTFSREWYAIRIAGK